MIVISVTLLTFDFIEYLHRSAPRDPNAHANKGRCPSSLAQDLADYTYEMEVYKYDHLLNERTKLIMLSKSESSVCYNDPSRECIEIPRFLTGIPFSPCPLPSTIHSRRCWRLLS